MYVTELLLTPNTHYYETDHENKYTTLLLTMKDLVHSSALKLTIKFWHFIALEVETKIEYYPPLD